jgi:hypothetical protein
MIRFLLPVVILLVFTLRSKGQVSGSLDNSFHTSVSFGPNIPEIDKSLLYPIRCIPATEGRFYVMGSFDHFSGHPTKGLARVFADGTVDTAFQVDFHEARFEELWPLKSGKILVRGSFTEHEGERQKESPGCFLMVRQTQGFHSLSAYHHSTLFLMQMIRRFLLPVTFLFHNAKPYGWIRVEV